MDARRRLLAGLVAAALFFAACGDDDDTAADDAATPDTVEETEDTTAPDETVAEPEADDDGMSSDADAQALAESAAFQASDFPADWEETAAEDDEDDAEENARIAACLGEDPAELYPEDQAEVTSPTFTSPDGQNASNNVEVAESADQAAFQFTTLTSDAAIDCVSTEAERAIAEDPNFTESGAEVGELSIQPLSVGAIGDDTAAFQISIPVSVQGQDVTVYLDVVLARVGRVLISAQVTSFMEPFPTADFEGFVSSAVDRIDAEAAA